MTPFDYQPRTRIVFGPGRVELIGGLARELGATRVLVVSDPGVIAAGCDQGALESLAGAGIVTQLFDFVRENPTTEHVEAGVAAARAFQPDLLVGLGGGSSMDCAKGINFVLTSGGQMQDYWGIGKAKAPMLPMIAVPTTAGTGSEKQSFALISDAKTHVKMACGDKQASFRVAILDPALTLTQPSRVTALTGIDAMAHALETYVTKARNPLSLAFSREAWQLLSDSFAKVLSDPSDLDARGSMQLGASFAGLAIENSMLGATHALANPLTARYGIVHGEAIGIMLPHVIRFNAAECGAWYQDLVDACPSNNGSGRLAPGAEGLAQYVSQLADRAGLPPRLAERGVQEVDLDALAHDAGTQWTAGYNPRSVDQGALRELYRQAL